MATAALSSAAMAREDRFFLTTAIAMAIVVVCGFSFQLAMGRSTFASPPHVHAHAVVFMGWVAIYVAQTAFATTGSLALHRRLGWIAAAWVVLMVIMAFVVTIAMVRQGTVVFFFKPLQFLIFDPLTVLTFAALTAAAIVNRRRTDWHRRLHYCGMALLLGPAFGRMLPLPLLIPYAYEATFVAVLIFPAIGVAADLRRRGRVHPAWTWGIGTMLASKLLVEALSYGPLGLPLYQAVTAGSPGARVAPLAFPGPPTGSLRTGRSTSI